MLSYGVVCYTTIGNKNSQVFTLDLPCSKASIVSMIHTTLCQRQRSIAVLVAQSCPTLCDPGTVARQSSLSMGFSRQEYWSRLPFSSPRDLPDSGIKPGSPALQADSLLSGPQDYSIRQSTRLLQILNKIIFQMHGVGKGTEKNLWPYLIYLNSQLVGLRCVQITGGGHSKKDGRLLSMNLLERTVLQQLRARAGFEYSR